ncbi:MULTISPECIES: 2Fe-2S iron-sulfur cluster-binding protein [unclassified Haloferax]|uniref:2Fe-2S iron-sulfur cluster-binding protein n=1 Tax=unclassified Haloferax TaxID=2625095 RepID=UPI0002B1F258|nr:MULTISPECIES: 2Fe-2S iron-sulfur cluster-binding protein [unclassified Haloferax]ELZ60221.1 ferredoxin-like protein [Haloferax sp. ATCC BAA-646]ELZ64433.1 ferredoxin-like protein [Haloferax sp. ATCC BAA-645]ELZ69732.1 ferredoxin-like protein [Haloferax sp. ATCC BAA-644]
MPTVHFRGREIECNRGDVLRDVLRAAGESPHNGHSSWFNCRGGGSCGTCAVRVRGPVTYRTKKERRRFRFPPHDPDSGLRLACQTVVLGDLWVEKYPGFWGQHVDDAESDADEAGEAEGAQDTADTPDTRERREATD